MRRASLEVGTLGVFLDVGFSAAACSLTAFLGAESAFADFDGLEDPFWVVLTSLAFAIFLEDGTAGFPVVLAAGALADLDFAGCGFLADFGVVAAFKEQSGLGSGAGKIVQLEAEVKNFFLDCGKLATQSPTRFLNLLERFWISSRIAWDSWEERSLELNFALAA